MTALFFMAAFSFGTLHRRQLRRGLLNRKTDSGDRGNHPSCPQRSVMELLGQILIQPEIGKVCEVVSILQGGILA